MKPPIHSSPIEVNTTKSIAYEMSSDLEEKRQEVWCKRYGGYRRAAHAATVIQRAYRQYTLTKNFDKMCKRRSGIVGKKLNLETNLNFISTVNVDDVKCSRNSGTV